MVPTAQQRTGSWTEKGKEESRVRVVQVWGKEPKELVRTDVSNFSVKEGEGGRQHWE